MCISLSLSIANGEMVVVVVIVISATTLLEIFSDELMFHSFIHDVVHHIYYLSHKLWQQVPKLNASVA